MFSIKQIASYDTFPVRQPVLRPGKPAASCIFEGDDLPDTTHFGIYEHETLAGVLSVFRSSNTLFKDERQYQLRGMAVLPQYQKKGLGERLMAAAETLIRHQEGQLIWFNAREAAAGFYEKMGYRIIGGQFVIGDIGTHYLMYRRCDF